MTSQENHAISAPKIKNHRRADRVLGGLPTITEDNVDEEDFVDCTKLGLKRPVVSRQIPRSVRGSNDYDMKKLHARHQSECAGIVSQSRERPPIVPNSVDVTRNKAKAQHLKLVSVSDQEDIST